MRVERILAVLGATFAIGGSQAALAQEPGADSSVVLEEITVTARKREESLQEVPLTITAFSGKALEKLGISNVFDLAALTPGLTYENTGWRNGDKATIRGLTVPGQLPSQQKTSVFVDGIYVAGAYSSQSLANLERVEVLKGPQSAFFGRSTFAGAINYVTRDPGDTLAGKLMVSAASLGQTEASATVGGPLRGDAILGQLNAYYYNFDGPSEWRNSPDGQRSGSANTHAVSGKLIFAGMENLRIEARTAYNQDDDGHFVAGPVALSARNGRFIKPNGQIAFYPVGEISAGPLPLDFNLSDLTNPGIDRHIWRNSLEATTEVAGQDLVLLAAYNKESNKLQQDTDFSNLPARLQLTDTTTTDTSFEARLSSRGEGRFRYLLGAYYLDLDLENDNLQLVGAARTPNPTRSSDNTRNLSGFFGLYFEIAQPLTLALEGRYQRDKITSRNLLTNVTYEGTFNSFLPRANLEYRVKDGLMFYAIASIGNNPGAFNSGNVPDESLRKVKEEKLKNYEIGMKSEWLDGRLLLNGALFSMRWSDQQFRRSFNLPSGAIAALQTNEGNSQVDGFELEAAVIPTPGVDLRATLSYNDARYTSFCSANLSALTGRSDLPAPNACIYVNGNQLEAQAKWSGSLSAGYTRTISDQWNAFIRGDVQYTDRKYASEMNLAYAPETYILNARLGVEGERFGFEIFGRNLTDEDAPYRVGRGSDSRIPGGRNFDQTVVLTYRTPRQIGARLTYRF